MDRAIGYGVEGHSVDGTDLEDCLRTIGDAVERARNGRGPQMVVARLLRLCGHGEHDDASYVSAKLKSSELGRDCLEVARQEILENGWATRAELEEWQAKANAQIEEAVATAQHDPQPDPAHETWSALATKHLAEGLTNVREDRED